MFETKKSSNISIVSHIPDHTYYFNIILINCIISVPDSTSHRALLQWYVGISTILKCLKLFQIVFFNIILLKRVIYIKVRSKTPRSYIYLGVLLFFFLFIVFILHYLYHYYFKISSTEVWCLKSEHNQLYDRSLSFYTFVLSLCIYITYILLYI